MQQYVDAEEQAVQQQAILDVLPAAQTAWLARAAALEAQLEGESDPGVIRDTLNAAAQEVLVEPPEGLSHAALLRFEGRVNALRAGALGPLYETLLP